MRSAFVFLSSHRLNSQRGRVAISPAGNLLKFLASRWWKGDARERIAEGGIHRVDAIANQRILDWMWNCE